MVEFVLSELDQTVISEPLIIQGKSVLLDGADACDRVMLLLLLL